MKVEKKDTCRWVVEAQTPVLVLGIMCAQPGTPLPLPIKACSLTVSQLSLLISPFLHVHTKDQHSKHKPFHFTFFEIFYLLNRDREKCGEWRAAVLVQGLQSFPAWGHQGVEHQGCPSLSTIAYTHNQMCHNSTPPFHFLQRKIKPRTAKTNMYIIFYFLRFIKRTRVSLTYMYGARNGVRDVLHSTLQTNSPLVIDPFYSLT